MTSEPRVVIVGAGAAGLAAAWSLIRNGLSDVIVLEAQDRIGGRIHTMDIDGRKVDFGAQFVHGQGDNPVYKVAKKHNLLADYKGGLADYNSKFRFSSGQSADSKIADDLFQTLYMWLFVEEAYAKLPWKSNRTVSFGEYMEERYKRSVVKASDTKDVAMTKSAMLSYYHNMTKAEYVCDTWKDLPLAAIMDEPDLEGDEYGGLKDGFQSLLDIMIKDIPNHCIKLGQPVTKISWGDPKVHVSTTEGSYVADHVIVTSSFGYLKENHSNLFNPSLDPKKAAALQSIGFGTLGKIFLEFEQPFWETEAGVWYLALLWRKEDEQINLEGWPDGTEPWYLSLEGFVGLPHYPRILVGFLGGHHGNVMESRPAQEVGRVCHQLLQKFLGRQDIPEPSNVRTTSWHANEYFRGSYSFVKVPSGPQIYDELAQPLPSKQNPRLQFAGEGTERNHHSTVQGALISGEREAQRLLALYGRTVNHALWRTPPKETCSVM